MDLRLFLKFPISSTVSNTFPCRKQQNVLSVTLQVKYNLYTRGPIVFWI